jgi:hypothetical protein
VAAAYEQLDPGLITEAREAVKGMLQKVLGFGIDCSAEVDAK